MRRSIVIGDVHGCALEFEALLQMLEPKPEDRIFQVGDLINRGPDSHGAIKLARKYKVSCVLGNHEVRLLRSRKQGDPVTLKRHEYATLEQLTETDWQFLEAMPPYIYQPKHETVIVHAGFLPTHIWHEQPIDTITQIRVIDADGNPSKNHSAPGASQWTEHWRGPPFVVYGHIPRAEVYRRPGSIGIDTGCVYGGHLTAYIIEDQTIVQVPAEKAYA